MKSINLSYTQLTRWRGECSNRFGSNLKLPVLNLNDVYKKVMKSDSTILDVGAGVSMPLKQLITSSGQKYYSLDNDASSTFDFNSVDEIPSDLYFDLIWANQFLEHLSVQMSVDVIFGLVNQLVEGGIIGLTVPNVAHPVRYWSTVTHITPWSIGDLYGLLRESGVQVEILGRYNKFPFPRNIFKGWITRVVCEVFRVDWCDSIIIVGKKTNFNEKK